MARKRKGPRSQPGQRKIPPNTRSVTGRRYSGKNERLLDVESGLEARMLALLEFDPQYAGYKTQLPIDYVRADGRVQNAWPDFLAYFADEHRQPELIEVKYRSDIRKDWATLKPRFRAARRYALDHGWKYRIWTEKELRIPYTANAIWLLPYRRRRPSDADLQLLLDQLAVLNSSTPTSLLKRCTSDLARTGELIPALWHLVATFRILADLNVPINMESTIWMPR